jgi:putative phosphoesterase
VAVAVISSCETATATATRNFLSFYKVMIKIGLLSDTHGFVDDKIIDFFNTCDEIWHAGDIGNLEVINKLSSIKPVKAVYGNVDGADIRMKYKKQLRFTCEDMNIWITHIGGYPGHYKNEIRDEFAKNPPNLFICGHSHILKIIFDKKYNLLFINPGAAGIFGFHKVRTAVRFVIDKSEPKQMEVLEIKRN